MSAFTQASFERLHHLLDQDGKSATAMTIDQVQGFLLACVSGPDHVDRDFWLPEILADDDFNPDDREEIIALTDTLATQFRQQLAAGLSPALLVFEGDEGEADYSDLCAAYLYAMDLLPTDWLASRQHDEELAGLLIPVVVLGSTYEEALPQLSPKEQRQLHADLRPSLNAIYQYWQGIINKPQPVRREGRKIGRNDACPCGSGKKYKACCGKSA